MLSIIAELLRFLRMRRKYWLLPVIAVLALLGGIVVLGHGSAVAPFVYAIF